MPSRGELCRYAVLKITGRYLLAIDMAEQRNEREREREKERRD